MNALFDDIADAHRLRHGYILAQTLSPVPPPGEPNKLRQIWQSTNSHSVKGDMKHFLKASTGKKLKLSNDEVTGWVEVYTAYWHAIGEILAGESGKVFNFAMSVFRQSLLTRYLVNLDQGIRCLEASDVNANSGLQQSRI